MIEPWRNTMDKLKMQTANKADENFRKLAELFPNAVTETIDENGEVVRAIDKDVLMQEISVKVVDGKEERYQFTWPDKKKSVLLANAPISKTLRPCREESVDFDTTENLYIEGDNLEVLKLLQETYLGKIKMIYIEMIMQSLIQGYEKLKGTPLQGMLAFAGYVLCWGLPGYFYMQKTPHCRNGSEEYLFALRPGFPVRF